jgi:hypothetical protein
LISPRNISSFIEDLKVLVDLGYDALFKLTQTNNEEEVRKFIDITGTSGITKDIVRSFVEIDAHFDQNLFPEEIDLKEVDFSLDAATCSNVLSKFSQRFNILNDELAKISFKACDGVQGEDCDEQRASYYQMVLNSRHMRTVVESKAFSANFTEMCDMKRKYKVALKKEVFMKLFSILKVPG